MTAPRQQHTIARAVTVHGVGYWSGQDVRVELRPAEPSTGVVFVRSDLNPPVRIEALVKNRVEMPRRTSLSAGGVAVEMIEHLMAALAGLQVDNCEVWIDSAELPGLDGSSLPYVEAIDRAAVVTQPDLRPCLRIRETLRLGDDESWIEAQPTVQPSLSVRYRLDYGRTNPIGKQTYVAEVSPDLFRREIASARTFMLKEEAEWLVAQGLGRRATTRDLLIFDRDGPIDNTLRFRDECVRHKALDLIGDLALAGCDLAGHVVAHKSGHRLNAELVRALAGEGKWIGTWRRTA
jgi:UDP-3-O-acyl N-acetylglucosamine deacetylase